MYKYINHQAGTAKANTRIILIQMCNIFRLIIGVEDYGKNHTLNKITLITNMLQGLNKNKNKELS